MGIKLWAIFIALTIILPILTIFVEITHGDYSLVKHFFDYLFVRYMKGTLIITFGVLFLSIVIGTTNAWLVANYKFPFSNFFEYALILPLAIPGYIFSFCYVGIMEFQGLFHKIFGFRFDFMNTGGAIFVLALSLYPYIYIFAKTSFKTQGQTLFDVCKIHKLSAFSTFFKVGILVCKPAITGASMLVIMETLSDYGTAAYYGVDTFSAGIFKLWFDLGDSYSASLLAAILMVIVFIILVAEYINKNKKPYILNAHDISVQKSKTKLTTSGSFAAFLWCGIVFLAAFAIPFSWLVYWSVHEIHNFKIEFFTMAKNSFLIAAVCAFIISIISVFLVFASRIIKEKKLSAIILKICSLGYAIPGASIGVCVMTTFALFDKKFGLNLLSAGFSALIFGYVIRFMATSIYAIENGYDKIPKHTDESALLLNSSKFILFFKIHFPLLKQFFILSFIVSFIDIVKELPLSMILRPMGFETLSIRAFFYANDERLYAAALPSLMIVLLSLIAVIWMEIISKKKNENNFKY